MRRIIITSVLVVLVLFGAWFAVSAYTMSRLTVTDGTLTDIGDLTLEGALFSFNITVENPGVLPVKIRGGEYNITFVQTGETIATGTIGEAAVPAHGSVNIPIETRLTWKPSLAVLARGLVGQNATAQVSGTIEAGSMIRITEHFDFPIDIRAYFAPFLPKDPNELIAGAFRSWR